MNLTIGLLLSFVNEEVVAEKDGRHFGLGCYSLIRTDP